MSIEDNIALIHRVVDAVNWDNIEALDELFAPDAIRHDLAELFSHGSAAETQAFLRALKTAFPDLHVVIEQEFAADDRVTVVLKSIGTHQGEFLGAPPTGKRIENEGITIYRIADGKVAESWQLADWLGVLEQAGAVDFKRP